MPEIDSLLYLHDECDDGIRYPDSAMYYTIAALKLADANYGFDSDEYIDIFTDYMIHDARNNACLVCEDIYPLVQLGFNPFRDSVWRTYRELGKVLESLAEYEKAREMYAAVEHSVASSKDRLIAKIDVKRMSHKIIGGNLEGRLLYVMDDIDCLPSPDREEVSLYLAVVLSEYYAAAGNSGDARKWVEKGELVMDYGDISKVLRLMHIKYRLLLLSDHQAAVKCLDEALERAMAVEVDERDWELVAAILVERGDYALGEQLSIEEASPYYLKAFNMRKGEWNLNSSVMKSIVRRMLYFLRLAGEYEEGILIGEGMVDYYCKNGLSKDGYYILTELIDIYRNAGRLDEAFALMDRYRGDLMAFEENVDELSLLEGKLKMSAGDYESASSIFEGILSHKTALDNRIWAERFLAKSYYHLGDERVDRVSDKINESVKDIISSKLSLISPEQRGNWIKFCEDAIDSQLEMPGNERALRNAAELCLFKKSLLFRTSRLIESVTAMDSAGRESLNELREIRREVQHEAMRGDSVRLAEMMRMAVGFEQRLTNDYVDSDLLQENIDVALRDVCVGLGLRGVAVDFIVLSEHGRKSVGAFVYSDPFSVKYIPLIEYKDVVPVDISERIREKLSPELKDYEDIFFCADGVLNSVPLEYAAWGEEKRFHRVFHLGDERRDDGIGGDIVFIGVGDHNSPLHDEIVMRGNWTDLPGVYDELDALKTYVSPDSLTVILDDEATERRVKGIDNTGVTTLHISTHGVFRDSQMLNEAAGSACAEDREVAKRLLGIGKESLSALILRQGNLNWHVSELTGDEDDLLTAEEIELMSFPNLQLTVLSACETGLGITDSEGVWGLQRAFRIAGTRSLICSLKKVSDYYTSRFMEAFYEQVTAGATVYDSFRSAQRWLRDEVPDEPDIWQSFILIE